MQYSGAPSMGDFSYGGSTRVDQASALDLLGDDAGAPTPATVGKASVLEQDDDFSQGYGKTIDEHTRLKSPTLFITISYPFSGQRREVKVPWTEGMTLQHAWHAARLHDVLFRHIGIRQHSKHVNARKVRLTNVLRQGDVVMLKRGAA